MTRPHDPASTTRQELLEAATQIILRDGPNQLTLDAVAQESGRSKGGVLYHFPTKEALIRSLIESLCDDFNAELEEASSGARPGAWLRGYAEVTVDPSAASIEKGAALLAAVAANPPMLAILRERYEAWQARAVADGVEPARATLLRLAADGLWVADLLGLAPPSGALREQVGELLADLTREEPA